MSEPAVFGKVQLLAIASLLSGDDTEQTNGSLEDEISRQSRLLLIELCAKALLKKSLGIMASVEIDTAGSAEYLRSFALKQVLIEGDVLRRLSEELFQQIPRQACEDALSGAFWLMSIYEHLTSFRLEIIDSRWCLKHSKSDKRKQGQYFTPKNLTQVATHSALSKLLELKTSERDGSLLLADIAALKVVDPAMGGGAFLICALDFLTSRLEDANWNVIAENCLYGVDLDPLAAEVTRLVITFFCALKQHLHFLEDLPGLRKNLRVGNSLLGSWAADDGTHDLSFEHSRLAANIFHWQIEFAGILAKGGFDAVLCNPPWETLKPNAREFFSTHDQNYKAIGLLESEANQTLILERTPALKNHWQVERHLFDEFSRYLRASAEHARHLKSRHGVNRPFKAQGNSDLNAYKLFTELAYCLLANNGCMSLIVPSGIYTDQGTKGLRDLLFDEGDVFEICSYLNKDQTFAIHPSFNFCVFSVCKRKSSGQIKVSFGNLNASQSIPGSLQTFAYPLVDLQTFSPKWRNLLEVTDERDLVVLRKIYEQSHPFAQTLLEDGAQIKFKREFDLTNDSPVFLTRSAATDSGYICDQFGNYLRGNWQIAGDSDFLEPDEVLAQANNRFIKVDEIDSVLLPVYEGRMVGQFDCRQKIHITGSGRSASWNSNSDNSNLIQSQYLLPLHIARKRCNLDSVKIGYLAVGSATNVRTMIASALTGVPCGNSIPVLGVGDSLPHNLALLVCLNSFVFDFVLRSKMSGNNINFYLLQDCPLPDLNQLTGNLNLLSMVASLSFSHPRFARELLQLMSIFDNESTLFNSLSSAQRLVLRAALDALVAQAYGLNFADFAWILRGCDSAYGDFQDALVKGFWRVDKTQQSSGRHTTLALEYFRQLIERGAHDFCHTILVSIMEKISSDGVSHEARITLGPEQRKAQLRNDASNLEKILTLTA